MLSRHHAEHLRSSGLSDATIQAAGLFSADEHAVKQLLGHGVGGGGLVFPYTPTYARVRLDKPFPNGRHYSQPSGSTNRLYLRGLGDDLSVLSDPAIPLYITEGEKKALKANQEGLPTVAISGVWSWKQKLHGKSLDIPDLDKIEWKRRRAIVVFDSDAEEKPPVAWAEHALCQTLRERGAEVYIIRLPEGAQGQKYGLDDYLTHVGIEAFGKLDMRSVLDTDEGVPTFLRVDELADQYLHSVQRPVHRMKLGIAGLDEVIRGLAEGEVMTMLAGSGVGKTATMLNLVHTMTGGTVPALIFSLEMQGIELFERMVSLDSGLSGADVEARARIEDKDVMTQMMHTVANWKQTVIVDRPCSLSQVDSLIGAALKAGLWSEPLRLVCVDYLGMLTPERGGKAYEQVSEMAREVKRIAKRHRVRVLLLCQINREGETGGKPVTAAMARDSGVIVEASDYVLGLWRPELDLNLSPEERALYKGEMKVKVLKNRGGPSYREVTLRFTRPSLKIEQKEVA
jgi:KaiC/GvpD/RAD55 family RecA-like ATPase